MLARIPRLFAALPDAITTALFLAAWIAPPLLGPESVKNLMLVMLLEFIVMHSSAFFAVLVAASDVARGKRIAALCGLTLFYSLFVLGFALAFASAWPLYVFGWLFVSRFAHLWMDPADSSDRAARLMTQWVASGATYVLGAFATVLLPLPALGLTPQFIESMHLSGSGEWIERPYTVLAFGALYFAVQAWLKYATPTLRPAGTTRGRAGALPPQPSAMRDALERERGS